MLVPAVVLLAGLAMLPWRPQFLQLLFWGGGKLLLLSVGGAIGMAGTAIRAVVRQRKEPFCIHCGYTLLGLPDHHICPECGRPYSLRLIDEYRRDPHWFVQRYKAHRILPNADEPFLARPSTKPKSRDGT